MSTLRQEQLEDFKFHIHRYFKEDFEKGIFDPKGEPISLEEIMLRLVTTAYEEGWSHADHLAREGWDYREYVHGPEMIEKPKSKEMTLWQKMKWLVS